MFTSAKFRVQVDAYSGGLLYWVGDSDSASLQPAMAAAVLMFKYAPMASTPEKGASYNARYRNSIRFYSGMLISSQSFAATQRDYLLGKNPMSGDCSSILFKGLSDKRFIAVYLVGSHPNAPQNPHSALSSGGTDVTNIRDSPQTEAHILYGAMVGGPLESDKFWDYRDDYIETEAALDYNAMIPTIGAMMVRGLP